MSEQKVVLCWVTWGNVHTKTCLEIAQLSASGLLYGLHQIEGSLTVTARNAAFLNCLKTYPDLTHILMVDTDVCGMTPKMLVDMVNADVDMISPLTCERQPPYKPHPRSEEDLKKIREALDKPVHERGLIEVSGTGFGCVLIKREVIEKTAEYNEKTKSVCWFSAERIPRDGIQLELQNMIQEMASEHRKEFNLKKVLTESMVKAFNLGLYSRLHGNMVGEDYYFFEKARSMGFKLFIDLRYILGHIANFIYTVEDWKTYEYSTEKKASIVSKDPRVRPWIDAEEVIVGNQIVLETT